MTKYMLLIGAWTLYFFVHSFLADMAVKKYFNELLGKYFAGYRVTYNLISIFGLLLLLLFNGSISSSYIIEPTNWTRYFSLMLATAGILVIKAAFKQYSLKEFLGVTQNAHQPFKAQGILKHIRHPLYSGTILLVIGFWLFIPNVTTLVSACCIFIYLAVGIPLEERKLIKLYGEAYRNYKKEVPALIPKLW
jgi:methanethiol S-methyltransferase